jgi:hypothetical protein
MVRSEQTMHLSCVKNSTIFERSESSFHLSLSPRSTIGCVQNDFLSYVWRKPCTYIASILAIYQMNWLKHPLELRHLGVLLGASKMISYPMFGANRAPILHQYSNISNELTQASTWASSPRSTIGCVQNDFLSYVWRKPCTYLASILAIYQMNWLKHPLELCHLGVLSGASKTISEPTVCLAQTCTYLAPTPTLSLNGPKRDLTWPTSPWISIGCVQNDFWGYGTFGTNHAPILRQE